MTIRRLAGTLLILAVLAGAAAQCGLAAGAGQPVTLQLKGQPGEESRYATNFEFSANMQVCPPGSTAPIFTLAPRVNGNIATVQRVQSVAPNGDLTLNERAESFNVGFEFGDLSAQLKLAGPGGGPARFPALPAPPISTVISPRGQVLSLAGLENLPIPPLPAGPGGKSIDIKAAVPKLIAMLARPMYPDHPVRTGESWQTSFVIDSASIISALGIQLPPEAVSMLQKARVPLTITHTLTGVEMVNGVQTAAIKSVAPWKLQMPVGPPSGPQMSLSETGTVSILTSFDVDAGRVSRDSTDAEFTMSVGTGQITPVQMTMKAHSERQLVPPAAPPA